MEVMEMGELIVKVTITMPVVTATVKAVVTMTVITIQRKLVMIRVEAILKARVTLIITAMTMRAIAKRAAMATTTMVKMAMKNIQAKL